MNLWLTILGMGLITYAIRLSLILLWGRIEVSPAIRQALKFVPVAVLSAIILPELLLRSGELDISFVNARLVAGCVAILVAWRSKNVLWTIVVGMVVLWFLP